MEHFQTSHLAAAPATAATADGRTEERRKLFCVFVMADTRSLGREPPAAGAGPVGRPRELQYPSRARSLFFVFLFAAAPPVSKLHRIILQPFLFFLGNVRELARRGNKRAHSVSHAPRLLMRTYPKQTLLS